jgi:hypothetical protein
MVRAVTTMIYEIDGNELDHLLSVIRAIESNGDTVHTLHLNPRANGVAIKINEGMWSAPMGRPVERS